MMDSGPRVFFKCENFQRVGAFKFRGAFNALSTFTSAQRRAGVVAFSSGNHAQAVALSARLLGMPATIADGAQTQQLGDITFAIIQRDVDDIVTVTDAELVDAMGFLAARMKILVEPTGCLGVAAARRAAVAARARYAAPMTSDLLALAAIVLWGSLATLGVALAGVPPFLLTGSGLLVGSLLAWPLARFDLRRWRVPAGTLAVGAGSLFGFHFLLFMALRRAPAVQANLINYLWPLGMVVLAPLLLPGMRLRAGHVAAALLGFTGAAIAILGRAPTGASLHGGWHGGYLFAFGSALIWACYSLLTRRLPPFPTAAVGGFAAIAGLLALLCHVLLEPSVSLAWSQWALIALLGLGPLGGAFFLWDAALKRGDPRRIGLLAFLTPLLSTVLLMAVNHQRPSASIALATAMIVGAAFWGSRVGARG